MLLSVRKKFTFLSLQPGVIGVVSGSGDGEIRLWSLVTGDSDRFSSKHSASIVSIVCTESRIASLDNTEMLCIWDRLTRRCLQCISQVSVDNEMYIKNN